MYSDLAIFTSRMHGLEPPETGYNPRVAPWRVTEDDFPWEGEWSEKLSFLLRYAILAPSLYNTQPWQFRIRPRDIGVYADLARWPSAADPDRRELHLSIGGALENLLIAAERFGYGYQVSYFPHPGECSFVADVELEPESGESSPLRPHALFDMLTVPVTYPTRRAPLSPAGDLLEKLTSVVQESGLRLTAVDDGARLGFADRLETSVATAYADRRFRWEMGKWVGRGMLGDTFLRARLTQLLLLSFNPGPGSARAVRSLLTGAPALVVLSTERDEPADQVRAGQALQRLRLSAAVEGVALHGFPRIFSAPHAVREAADLLEASGGHPQALIALAPGKPEKKHRPRRTLEEVLLETPGTYPELDDIRFVI